MTLTRTCELDNKLCIDIYYDVSIMVKEADEIPDQDPRQEIHGDYCKGCVMNGNALKDLFSKLEEGSKVS